MRAPRPSYRPEFPSTFLEQAEEIARHRTVPYQWRQRATLVLLLRDHPLGSNLCVGSPWPTSRHEPAKRWAHR
jgi:hypothetical protein